MHVHVIQEGELGGGGDGGGRWAVCRVVVVYIELSFWHACIYVFLISNFSGVWLPPFCMFKRQEQSEDIPSLSIFISFFLSLSLSLFFIELTWRDKPSTTNVPTYPEKWPEPNENDKYPMSTLYKGTGCPPVQKVRLKKWQEHYQTNTQNDSNVT